ncbi:MAG TPA: hypothetical protein VEX69_07965 [Candidatus Limnocylindria bacterium]|nr:hypothetical protein [Candidatus Limnocylindria bacterium]
MIVRGIDLLGQPFEERTTTLAFNLHGCRYASKHHLPKNTWVTLELPQSTERRNVRARVSWIQRPHSVREFFQIAAELETPGNLWGLEFPPESWALTAASYDSQIIFPAETNLQPAEAYESTVPKTLATYMGKLMSDMKSASPEMPEGESAGPFVFTPAADSPLLRELRAELEREAMKAVEMAASQAHEKIQQAAEEIERRRSATAEEYSRRWKEEAEHLQNSAREQFSEQLRARQSEFLGELKSEFEENFSRARELMVELDRKAQALRAENEAAAEAASRMAQARLQIEVVEAAEEAVRRQKQPAEAPKEDDKGSEAAVANWRERLESEMTLAQAQWNELLQSSLDSGMHRLVGQLSERSQDILRTSEQKITERINELRQPFAQVSAEARETVSAVRAALEQELTHARSALAEIEQSASRTKEYSAQFEAASQDSLNVLHRRLENMLDAQTTEMNRRVESLAAGLAQRAAPALDALGQQFTERTVAEVESKLAPHLDRVPELICELTSREVQAEEGLRLHRERLRQLSESNQREVASRMASTLGEIHNDFEAARKEALNKWNEELEASGVRASHTAAESIGRAAEWFQQESRARLQVQVEQMLTAAGQRFEEQNAEAAQKFELMLDGQASARVAQIDQQLQAAADMVVGRSRTRLEEAAEAAAASFGQVLRGVAAQELESFTTTSRSALHERAEELERSTQMLLRNLETTARTSIDRFHAQMASQLEASITEGRSALAAEFASTLEGYRAEREAHQRDWTASLEQLSGEAAGKYQERLETMCDSWMVSSVRRLNEHGQNVIESLMRSADQALRDSCAKVFDGLGEMLRERATNAAGVAGFAPPANREGGEQSTPRNEAFPKP